MSSTNLLMKPSLVAPATPTAQTSLIVAAPTEISGLRLRPLGIDRLAHAKGTCQAHSRRMVDSRTLVCSVFQPQSLALRSG